MSGFREGEIRRIKVRSTWRSVPSPRFFSTFLFVFYFCIVGRIYHVLFNIYKEEKREYIVLLINWNAYLNGPYNTTKIGLRGKSIMKQAFVETEERLETRNEMLWHKIQQLKHKNGGRILLQLSSSSSLLFSTFEFLVHFNFHTRLGSNTVQKIFNTGPRFWFVAASTSVSIIFFQTRLFLWCC